MLCAMNSLGVFLINSPEISDADNLQNKVIKTPIDIGKWSFHSKMIPENTFLLVNKYSSTGSLANSSKESLKTNSTDLTNNNLNNSKLINIGSYEKRKKYFVDQQKRKNVTISPDHVYCMDFYDAYFDINTISLKLPGISLSAFKYWDKQPQRFVLKNRKDPKIVYLTVWFELVEKGQVLELDLPTTTDTVSTIDSTGIDTNSIHHVPLDIKKLLLKSETNENFEDCEFDEELNLKN